MRKQNISLKNSDGQHSRWICPEEAWRLEKDGQAVRISRRKDPKQVYQLRSFPAPSASQISAPALTCRDASIAASLPKGLIERLDSEKVRNMPAERVRRLQRLMGHQVIPFNAAVANAGE